MNFIPSKLYKLRVFESKTVYAVEGDGLRLIPADSDPAVEDMVNRWVTETQSLIINAGPLNLSVRRHLDVQIHTRSIPIIYAPPVEQGNDGIYGQQETTEMGKAAREAVPCNKSSTVRVSDGHGTVNRKIRIPVAALTAVPGNPEPNRGLQISDRSIPGGPGPQVLPG